MNELVSDSTFSGYVGVISLVIGVISLILAIKTFILAGSIDEAVKKERLANLFKKNKNKINSLLITLTKDIQEGNPEDLNRMAVRNFKYLLIELELYRTLFSKKDIKKINMANSVTDKLSKKQEYNLNDCNDFENQVQIIKNIVNGVL